MNTFLKISLFLLRVSMGWFNFLRAGITKVLNPEWSVTGYLKGSENICRFLRVVVTAKYSSVH